jgi:hypothetical protein
MAAGQDVPGTANITLGGLTMTTPTAVGFTGVLTGVDQVVNTAQALDIVDGDPPGQKPADGCVIRRSCHKRLRYGRDVHAG